MRIFERGRCHGASYIELSQRTQHKHRQFALARHVNNRNSSQLDGNNIWQEGYSMEQSVTIGAVNYVVTRQFCGNCRKQDLLCGFLSQKLDECEQLTAQENLNYNKNSLSEVAPKGVYE